MRYTDTTIQYDASDTTIVDDTVVEDLDYTSDDEGDFTTNPKVTITFGNAHSLSGLTINFNNAPPVRLSCKWTHAYGTSTKIYDVGVSNFVIYQSITNCTAIEIEILKAQPNSKIDIDEIKYGVCINWGVNDVKTGTLVLEVDRIAEFMSVNTLTFDVVDTTELTNPGNAEGLHKYLQKRKPIYPYEIIDGQKIPLGDFFLETFNYENNICHITATSYVAILDTIQYNNGTIYNGTSAGTVLADIFSVAGVTNYTIDSTTASQPLYGTIIPCTCKEALRQVLFACHSVIDTSDASNIKIKKSTTGVFGELTKDNKFSTRVNKKDYISGVNIKYTHYAAKSESENVINDVYGAGTHKIVFTTPYTNYSIVGATLDNYGTFFVEFTVSGTQQVIVTAYAYEAFDNSVQVNHYEADEDESVREFSTTLCNITTARALASKLLNFYSNRFEIEAKYLADDVAMDKRLEIYNPTEDFANYIGIVTSRTIDLTGGFIDTARYIGYFDTSSTQYYMTGAEDEEVIADNSLLI